MKDFIRLLRPKQNVKNVFVFAPCMMAIAFSLTRSKFACRRLSIADAAIQRLLGECGQFNFCRVQPTGFLGRIMKYKFLH